MEDITRVGSGMAWQGIIPALWRLGALGIVYIQEIALMNKHD
jgi:hypothetical protein